MTVPTRKPNASRPYPIADHSAHGPRPESTANGWVPVIIAGVVAAFVIAIAGVIGGLVVVNIRESETSDPAPTPAASAPVAPAPVATGPIATGPIVASATAPVPQRLDPLAVQRGLVRLLGQNYGLDDVREVKCPGDQPIEVGTTFDCTTRIDGLRKTVTVTVTDLDGAYEVSRPY